MDYLPIRTITLRKGTNIPFELFIFIDKKHIAYLHKDTLIDDDRLIGLERKGIKKMFILASDEDLYLEYLDKALEILEAKDVEVEERAKVAHASIQSEADHIESTLNSAEAFEKARARMGKVSQFFSTDSKALKSVLDQIGIASAEGSQHPANVATLSIGLAVAVGIDDPEELFELGIAAICHDLGKLKLGLDPNIPGKDLPKDKRELYWKHSSTSAQLLGGKKYITPWVLKLIEDHHEVGFKKGFPNKKNIESLDEPSQILNLCNDFDDYAISLKKAYKDMFQEWKKERATLFMPDHVEGLENLIQQ